MTIARAPDSPTAAGTAVGAALPAAGSVLAVIARPGQESAELGGLLFAFRRVSASSRSPVTPTGGCTGSR